LSYPWSSTIYPQDLSLATEVLREEKLDLSSDLHLDGYEGALTFLVPTNDTIDFENKGFGSGDEIHVRGKQEKPTGPLRYSEQRMERFALSRSAWRRADFTVFRDGILVPGASRFHSWGMTGEKWFPPRLVINLEKSKAPQVNLARTEILQESRGLDVPIWDSYLRHMAEKYGGQLYNLSPKERFYQFGRLLEFHQLRNVPMERLAEILPFEKWPVPLLEVGGRIQYVDWKGLSSQTVFTSPSDLSPEIGEILRCEWLDGKQYNGPLEYWQGEPCVIRTFSSPSRSLDAAKRLVSHLLSRSHAVSAVRFLTSPFENDQPLLQTIRAPMTQIDSKLEIEPLLEKMARNPDDLDPREFEYLDSKLPPGRSHTAMCFLPPYETTFAYGSIFNLKHPATRSLLKCIARLELAAKRKELPEANIGKLDDALHRFHGSLEREAPEEMVKRLMACLALATDMKLFESSDTENLLVDKQAIMRRSFTAYSRNRTVRQFGHSITSVNV
jgi:hypothetical protein